MAFVSVDTVVAVISPCESLRGLSELWSQGPPIVTPTGGNAPAAAAWYAALAAEQQWPALTLAVAQPDAMAGAAGGAAGGSDPGSWQPGPARNDGGRGAEAFLGASSGGCATDGGGGNDEPGSVTVYVELGGIRGIAKRSVRLKMEIERSTA